ncbi:glycogen debranching protein [Niastella caeni]|uniref:Glycogen debranching protein n=1 Tax=Niastella caeni TaxID=2569763 RepID=A0A4S8HIE8_9BACT|nr:amylo-alpha-1,6-glucosidase [Niastella caeni]THU34897.1 glycogen debranching protein [Niastella caeni]
MLSLPASILQNYNEAISHEWLETNGLGAFSSSSVINCNTRRYHGLLVAAVVPPADRMVLVSKLDETIISNGNKIQLGVNDYGAAIHPKGYNYITGFTKYQFPEFVYEVDGIQLKKTIAMVHHENTVLVIYDVIKADQPFTLELLPLLAVRGYHNLMHANGSIHHEASFGNGILKTNAGNGTPGIFIKVPGSTWQCNADWYYNFHYNIEQSRGLDHIEDLFTPGALSVTLKQGDSLGCIVSTDDPHAKNAYDLLQQEKIRRRALLNNQPDNETLQQLLFAADQFIVKRAVDSEEGATVIAGYHWFTDWGRDTMISLPGLCLSTGRYDDARKVLLAFAKNVSKGMLPNRFQDNGEPPEYNNVDGTLWYFIAIYKYLQATNDFPFVIKEILPVLKEIIDWHYRGTRYNIHADDDGLLYAGETGFQLTWMDARIGNWVVTPRMGKPVEIQALWYNALIIFAELLALNDQPADAAIVRTSAVRVKESFLQKFWYAEGNYLYDVIDEQGRPDATLRPNQLFAISLPFPLIDDGKAAAVLAVVTEKLYTPVGMRSLSPDDARYTGVYEGDPYKRDSSYHQGAAWSWLLGAYIDVIMKLDGSGNKARTVINNFRYHLNEGCIGSVAEIFDADAPHRPKGCVAQAWGVAELLRVIKEYGLLENKK